MLILLSAWKLHWSSQLGKVIDCYWLLTSQNFGPSCQAVRTGSNQSRMAAANEISSQFCLTTLFVPQSIGKGIEMSGCLPRGWSDWTTECRQSASLTVFFYVITHVSDQNIKERIKFIMSSVTEASGWNSWREVSFTKNFSMFWFSHYDHQWH